MTPNDPDDLLDAMRLGDHLVRVAGWLDQLPAEHRDAAAFHVDRCACAIAQLADGHADDPMVAALAAKVAR
jgi:hypothetical protein